MPPTPRARARLLARSGRAEPGLFAPLVLAQAAEIEALSLDAFLTDPTKLATARLAATAPGDPVLVAAITGPATLAAELVGDVFGGDGDADRAGPAASILEALGEATLEVVKRFLVAGANLIVVVEEALPPPA